MRDFRTAFLRRAGKSCSSSSRPSGRTNRPQSITASISNRAVAILEETALKSDLGVCDALIFAIACEMGETLLSGNKKHSREVPLLNAVEFKPE